MLIGTQGKTWAITKHTQTHTHDTATATIFFRGERTERRYMSTTDLRPHFCDLYFRKVNVELKKQNELEQELNMEHIKGSFATLLLPFITISHPLFYF